MEMIEQGVSQTDVIGTVAMSTALNDFVFDLSDPASALYFGGSTSSSGIRVTEKKALMHPAVWQAVTMISGDVASLPLELFRKMPDGDRVLQDNHPLHEIIHWQANEEMSAFKFWRRMLVHRLLWNNAYAFIYKVGGRVRELIPLLPDRTSAERVDGVRYFQTEIDGKLTPLPQENVFHLEGTAIDNLEGFRFVTAAREAIGLGLAELNFASTFYKNGGRVGGVLELPLGTSKTARDKIEEGFRKNYSSNEAFKTVILRDNAKFHQAQVTPEAAQVVEARQESVRDIARLFNVRAGKLNEETRTSFASKSEDNRDHHDTTLRPHLCDIVQECRSKLLTDNEKRQGYYFKHDTREFLKMDFQALTESLSTLRSAEIINSDEARQWLNMNKREDGLGGNYENPNINPGSNDRTGSSGDAEATVMKILSNTITRMGNLVADRAQSKADTARKFRFWLDKKYDDQADGITTAIKEVADAAKDVVLIPRKQINDVVATMLEDAKSLLISVLTSSSEQELSSTVAANMSEWCNSCGHVYSQKLMENHDG